MGGRFEGRFLWTVRRSITLRGVATPPEVSQKAGVSLLKGKGEGDCSKEKKGC